MENTSDVISRQAAIDAIKSIPDHEDAARANALGLAENAIMTLPAVQPEILACGEGELNVPDMDDGETEPSRESDTEITRCSDDTISRQAAIYIASGYCHPANVANELAKLPSVQPERRYTVRELSVFRHGISLSLCSKKSAQRWHYDEDTAIEIEFLEHLFEKVGENMRGSKDDTD